VSTGSGSEEKGAPVSLPLLRAFGYTREELRLVLGPMCDAGVEPVRLSQLRVTAAFAVMVVALALTRPGTLRLRRAELPLLAVYGILGVATTQFLYFVAIERLPIGLALLIEFTAPIMVALWFHFGLRHPTRPPCGSGW
jgi:drug/metabolite transporter (DMT)-like permease